MGFVGNRNGPRKSEILRKLGANYFGISDMDLSIEIEINKNEEFAGEIDPVYLDDKDKPFLFFYAPGKKIQKFYLYSAGYKLKGKIKAIINNEEKEIDFE